MSATRVLLPTLLVGLLPLTVHANCDPSESSAVSSLIGHTAGAASRSVAASSVVAARNVPPSPVPDIWKHALDFPGGWEPFLKLGSPRWVKFTLLTDDLTDVGNLYFHNANRFEFHFPFASQYVERFKGVTLDEFNARTLEPGASQEAILGTVLGGGKNQWGIKNE